MMPFPVRRPALLALLLAATSCSAPLQNGGVEIIGGIEARLGILCRFRPGGDTGAFCRAPEAPLQPARVRRIARAEDQLRGPRATGKVGDYLLENDQIAVVVSGLEAERPGVVLDAADLATRHDELGALVASIGTPTEDARYNTLRTGSDANGGAFIELRGTAPLVTPLPLVTRYTLYPGQRGLLITTTIENRGDAPTSRLELGDSIAWSSSHRYAPEQKSDFEGEARAPWIGVIGTDAAYGLINADQNSGEAGLRINAESERGRVVFAALEKLPAHRAARYERVLVVASRADTLAVATELFYLQGGAPGGLVVTPAAGSAPLPEDARIVLEDAAIYDPDPHLGTVATGDPLSLGVGALGKVVEAPPGRYVVSIVVGAGAGAGAEKQPLVRVPVLIEAGKATKAEITLPSR